MNTMMNMDPFRLLDEIFNVRGSALRNIRARAAGKFPPVNVFLDDNAIIIDMELPGKTAADVELSLEPQAAIVADKPHTENDKQPSAPTWSRRLNLPFRVDANKANAKFTNGILRLELPKVKAEGVRKITIA